HAVQAEAGVVDDDVQASEALVGLLYGLGHGGPVRDIQRERQDLAAVGRDQVGQGIGVAGGRCDLVAARQCRLDEPAAEATGGTCDEPDLAHKKHSFGCQRRDGCQSVSLELGQPSSVAVAGKPYVASSCVSSLGAEGWAGRNASASNTPTTATPAET